MPSSHTLPAIALSGLLAVGASFIEPISAGAAPTTAPSTQRSSIDGNRNSAAAEPSDALTPHRFVHEEKFEKGPYLGVAAVPASRLLRKHLGLARGMGLVIDMVAPGSPAVSAGVASDDVLVRLDDQFIVNREQLAVLVRSHHIGDEVRLGIIRDGKPISLTAKLIEHELEPLGDDSDMDAEAHFGRMLPEMRIHPPTAGEPRSWTPPANSKPGDESTSHLSAASITWIEADRSYTVLTEGTHHRTFTVKDKEGKQLFAGPIDTIEQCNAIPPEFRERLDRLRNSGLEPGVSSDPK